MQRCFFLSFLLAVAVARVSIAQAPQSISYQAVARNDQGHALVNQAVRFRFSLLQGSAVGTSVFVESHSTTTNEFGLANLHLGAGTAASGDFSTINWGAGPYWLKVELDPEGGTSYVHMGTTQLLSVPYALHSTSASQLTGAFTEGRIPFGASSGGGLSQNNNLFWNNTEGLLGVGTNEPHEVLSVNGNISLAYSGFDPVLKAGYGTLQAADGKLYYWQNDTVKFDLTAGNGIYGGSGTVPAGTAVTIANTIDLDSGTFLINGPASKVGIGTDPGSSRLTIGHNKNGEAALTVKSTSESSGGVGLVQVVGRRNDVNASGTFAGTLALAMHRTGAAHSNGFHGISGRILFGGNHTDGDESNILFPASIAGIAEGTYSNSSTMPTGLAFYTGSGGVSPGTANVYAGVEQMRISNTGLVGIGTSNPAARLHVNGSLSRNMPVTVTTDYTVHDSVSWIIANKASGDLTLTLPAAASWRGREIMLKNLSGSGTVISASSNVVPVDGTSAGTAILPDISGSWVTLVSDGTNWVTMQQRPLLPGEETYELGYNASLGGYVFYLTPDKKHGLVVARTDQTTSNSDWYTAAKAINNPANHDDDAKKFTDWRLPDIHELELVYALKDSIGGFGDYIYWTRSLGYLGSSPYGSAKNFSSGSTSNNKGLSDTTNCRSRAVRSF